RLAEPRVGSGAGKRGGGAEVVQRPQDVVAPAVRMQEVQKALVRRLARAETTEEAALEQVLLARRARRSGLRRASGRRLVFQEPFQHVDGGGERRANRAVGPLAVPAAVVETLADEPLDDRRDV